MPNSTSESSENWSRTSLPESKYPGELLLGSAKEMKRYFAILVTTAFFIFGHYASAIIMGDVPLTVRIAKEQDSTLVYDVINLKKLGDAKSTAAWIYQLNRDTEGEEPHYSNSVHLEFSGQFDPDQVQLICDTFEMGKVYILTATIEKDGKKEEYHHEPDLENSLRLVGVSEEILKKVRDGLKKQAIEAEKNESADPVGGDQ